MKALLVCAAAILLPVALSTRSLPVSDAIGNPAIPAHGLNRRRLQSPPLRDGLRRFGRFVVLDSPTLARMARSSPPAHPRRGHVWQDPAHRLQVWTGTEWWTALKDVTVERGAIVGTEP